MAILITLGYLALEMRQNTTAIQATVRQAMVTDDREILTLQIENPILFTGRFGESDLTDEEAVQLVSFLIIVIRVRENQWLQYQNGVIDERTWIAYRSALTSVLSTEFVRAWWRTRSARNEFDPAFVELVDELFTETPPLPVNSVKESLGLDPD